MSSAQVAVDDDHHAQVDRVRDAVRRILIEVAIPTISDNNSWPVGFWAAALGA